MNSGIQERIKALGPGPVHVALHPRDACSVLPRQGNIREDGLLTFCLRGGELMRIHSGKDKVRFRDGPTPARIADAAKGKGAEREDTIWFAVEPAELAQALENPLNYRYNPLANTLELCLVDGELKVISGRHEEGHNIFGVEKRIRRALE